MGISFSARSAVSTASVMADRVRRSRPGRLHTDPHADCTMNSWKASVNGVVAAVARSTWSSPRTSRRTRMPSSYRGSVIVSSSYGLVRQMLDDQLGATPGSFDAGQVGPGIEDLESGTIDAVRELLRPLTWDRGILRAGNDERRCPDRLEVGTEVRRADRLAAPGVSL